MDDQINKFRLKIDRVDEKLIKLINKRINLVKMIAVLKNHGNDNIYQPKRELEIKKRNKKLAEKYGMSVDLIDEVFSIIKKHSREIQRECFEENE